MFSAWETYEKQLRIEKTRLSHQVWSHGGSTFKKEMTLNGHFSRPAETDPYADQEIFVYCNLKRFLARFLVSIAPVTYILRSLEGRGIKIGSGKNALCPNQCC